MTCIPIMSGGREVGYVCRPAGETRPLRAYRRHWCFGCRKRTVHQRMGFYPGGLSYYGPTFWWECPRCHEDRTTFPGCEAA